MSLENGRTSNLHMSFALLSFLLVITTYLSDAEGIAMHGTWVASILATFEGLFIIYIYTSISIKYPGKTLVQINNHIFGKYLGKVITIFYILYFIQTDINITEYSVGFTNSVMLEKTPQEILIIIILGISCYAVIKELKRLLDLLL